MQNVICEVHKSVLKSARVRINYGLPYFDEELIQTRSKLFPNANSSALGGCMIDENSPSYLDAMVCEECRQAETEWKKDNNIYTTEIKDIKI